MYIKYVYGIGMRMELENHPTQNVSDKNAYWSKISYDQRFFRR